MGQANPEQGAEVFEHSCIACLTHMVRMVISVILFCDSDIRVSELSRNLSHIDTLAGRHGNLKFVEKKLNYFLNAYFIG